MDPAIIQALINSGPAGVVALVLYLQMRADRVDRKEERATRTDFDNRRLEMDKSLERSLTALAMKIMGKPFDGNGA